MEDDLDQVPLVEPPSMYDRLKQMGKDMSWLDRLRAKKKPHLLPKVPPLANEQCGNLSVYLLKADGTLWTIERDGKPYAQVRATKNKPATDVFICVCCTTTFKGLSEARRHYEVQGISKDSSTG